MHLSLYHPPIKIVACLFIATANMKQHAILNLKKVVYSTLYFKKSFQISAYQNCNSNSKEM